MGIGSVHINPYCCFVGRVLVDVESDVETQYCLIPRPAYLSTLAVASQSGYCADQCWLRSILRLVNMLTNERNHVGGTLHLSEA